MEPYLKKEDWPKTVEDAVSFLIAQLSANYKKNLIHSEFDDLLNYNRFLGMNIRNALGLWRGNDALMRSCLDLRKSTNYDPDYVSLILIEEVWKELTKKNTNK